MKSIIKELPKSEVEMEIEVPAEEFGRFIEQVTLDLGKDLEIKGFRKGKAPKQIIEEHFGPDKILIEAAEMAVRENYRKAVLENKIEAILQPKIEIKKLAKGNEFIFSAKTAVLPEVELPDYQKIASKVERRKVSVGEKEIGEVLKWLQKSRASFSLKNQPAQKGDFVEIEYWLPENKEVIKDAFILGEGRFIPGFEEKLIGMKDGDEKKEISLRIKMKSVQNVELPEITDEFVKNLGKFDNLEALKKSIKEGINLEKRQSEKLRVRNEILEKISEKTKVEIPGVLIEAEQKQMLENIKKNVLENLNPVRDSEGREEVQKESISNGVKISWENYLRRIKKTEKEILDSLLPQVQKRIKNFLLLKEIGKREFDSKGIKEYTEEAEKIEKIFQILERI